MCRLGINWQLTYSADVLPDFAIGGTNHWVSGCLLCEWRWSVFGFTLLDSSRKLGSTTPRAGIFWGPETTEEELNLDPGYPLNTMRAASPLQYFFTGAWKARKYKNWDNLRIPEESSDYAPESFKYTIHCLCFRVISKVSVRKFKVEESCRLSLPLCQSVSEWVTIQAVRQWCPTPPDRNLLQWVKRVFASYPRLSLSTSAALDSTPIPLFLTLLLHLFPTAYYSSHIHFNLLSLILHCAPSSFLHLPDISSTSDAITHWDI